MINSLQELDFDFNLGKIPEGNIPNSAPPSCKKAQTFCASSMNLRPLLLQQSMPKRASKKPPPQVAQIQVSKTAILVDSDDDLESMIAARRKEQKSKSAGFCPKCGKSVLVTDKFCPSCGKSLN